MASETHNTADEPQIPRVTRTCQRRSRAQVFLVSSPRLRGWQRSQGAWVQNRTRVDRAGTGERRSNEDVRARVRRSTAVECPARIHRTVVGRRLDERHGVD